ncbi:hypothetical protein ANANG_G00092440 [Anguilla anguilla]|uniref:Repulsive guidance molecule N-terminal domain-containing protein n=1 Tax=Anguilla anguilla TaxID=7936 RepID=A0A9D3MM05_ANGAN|nr:hypothetical protein ANANG_G00092440 [Anguilla anguilla]
MRIMDPQNQDCNSYFIAQQQSRISILTEWIGMGKSGPQNLAKRRLWNSMCFMMVLLSLLLRPACCQQCRIQRCNSEYVASTSPSSGLQDDAPADVDYCIALRAYSLCTRRMARSCRGDLFYHSAVFRIKELFTQHNCSSDGPTSSARASGAPPRRGPPVPELCDYESRAAASGSAARAGRTGSDQRAGGPGLQRHRHQQDHGHLQGLPRLHGAEGVPGHHRRPALGLPGRDAERGPGGSLWIAERGGAGGRQVRIQAHYIGTSIIVRRVGRYLTFAIRTPEDSLGPAERAGAAALPARLPPQRADPGAHAGPAPDPGPAPAPPPRPAYTVERATARCRERCRWRTCTSSPASSTCSPRGPRVLHGRLRALEDLKALPPSRLKQSSSPRTPPLPRGSARLRPSLLALLALLLLLL